MFIAKTSNQEHDSKIFIADSGATAHMVNSEENMTNLKDAKTRVTIGNSRIIIRKECGDWHGYQRLGKLHHLTLSNMDAIPSLHSNIFSVTQALQKNSQVMSEGDTLILKEKINRDSF